MTLKEATANSLLMFVAASCVVLIVKAVPQSGPAAQVSSSALDGNGISTAGKLAGALAPALENGVVVYYLHSNTRCPTCRTIEAYAQEAVQSGFADELKAGKVQWQVVNYEEPGNEHFAKDYEVVAPNVVLVKRSGGKQVAWKGLPEVWEHVDDKAAFIRFVQGNLREFLQESGTKTKAVETAPAPASKGAQEGTLPIPE